MEAMGSGSSCWFCQSSPWAGEGRAISGITLLSDSVVRGDGFGRSQIQIVVCFGECFFSNVHIQIATIFGISISL